MGPGPPWDVSVQFGTPLFRSVRGVPLFTGSPHHDKVIGPRVREGVEVGRTTCKKKIVFFGPHEPSLPPPRRPLGATQVLTPPPPP